ncbi:hypothetical protein [Sphingobacterium sp. LRF_L2]|uniref:hypothetical protein n=1 Tax=Sphingobacterium sp. LRF_L2 TaxID=3369421 RepID=UPI003F6083FE
MKITKELLERYEEGLCADYERLAVQEWLESDSVEVYALDETIDAPKVKAELWDEIASYMDRPDLESVSLPQKRKFFSIRKLTSVASVLIVCFGFAWYFYAPSEVSSESFIVKNTNPGLQQLTEQFFDLTLTQNSSANIDVEAGKILVSGDLIFMPKRDLLLRDEQHKENFSFKEGEVYYLSVDPNTSELIVWKETDVQFLPAILQKHIRKQFHLS